MKKKATFSREQLSKSKTFGYGKDLVLAVLEDRDYTKDEAEKEIQTYLTYRVFIRDLTYEHSFCFII